MSKLNPQTKSTFRRALVAAKPCPLERSLDCNDWNNVPMHKRDQTFLFVCPLNRTTETNEEEFRLN